ncbi:LacI family DNA-binding transcriptional regulator [Paenibacillus sp. MWE-103]|uniref:LacI family DNA-binding transcriptional regulator n=1 Tax=Paenibacillus artemisiicola TaxID=1172618 RepID=A0ABS3W4B0_9BACL|nr:LacI family DNA-binding transcriptional regulator [Paenibacillus artemisiicola]
MNKKVTTYDISNELGISRNTVSKALNNHASISEETKKKVFEQAIAMGYKKMVPGTGERTAISQSTKCIAYLTRIDRSTNGYWMNLMRGVEDVLRGSGYDMKMSFIKDEDIISLTVPPMLNSTIDGFVVVGMLNKAYTEKLLAHSLPKVFIDLNAELPITDLKADLVLMESEESVYRITRHLIESGHREIGFIGDISSRSFRERWIGYSRALHEANIPQNPSYCITSTHSISYQSFEGIADTLGALEQLPTALVCGNDLMALHAIRFVKEKGLRVPQDIAISGFDQMKETELLDISLTTVANNEFQLGLRAAEELLYRIQRPNRAFEVIHLSTKVIFGESTHTTRP